MRGSGAQQMSTELWRHLSKAMRSLDAQVDALPQYMIGNNSVCLVHYHM